MKPAWKILADVASLMRSRDSQGGQMPPPPEGEDRRSWIRWTEAVLKGADDPMSSWEKRVVWSVMDLRDALQSMGDDDFQSALREALVADVMDR